MTTNETYGQYPVRSTYDSEWKKLLSLLTAILAVGVLSLISLIVILVFMIIGANETNDDLEHIQKQLDSLYQKPVTG